MSNPKYISLDTETGGLVPEVSLLTAYFAVLDENFEIIDELDLAIKPDNDIYHVTAEALSINKIDLVKHQETAVSSGKAGELFRDFLIRNHLGGKHKLIPLGHNVAFDLDKIYQNVLNKKEAEKYISYRKLDTGSTGLSLLAAKMIPETVSGSLGSYAEYFKVPKQVLHTARGDVITTVYVMKAMLELMKRGLNG